MNGMTSPQRHSSEAVNKGLFRDVMGRFATGVTVVTAATSARTFGMTANAFMAVSLMPPLCVVSVNRSAAMHGRLLEARRFGVSVLAEGQQDLANHFAGRRLAEITPEFIPCAETPVLRDAVAVIVADVVDATDCGDHTLFVGEIRAMTVEDGDARPLLFYRGRYARLGEAEAEEAPISSYW